jgi:hypothetical protein
MGLVDPPPVGDLFNEVEAPSRLRRVDRSPQDLPEVEARPGVYDPDADPHLVHVDSEADRRSVREPRVLDRVRDEFARRQLSVGYCLGRQSIRQLIPDVLPRSTDSDRSCRKRVLVQRPRPLSSSWAADTRDDLRGTGFVRSRTWSRPQGDVVTAPILIVARFQRALRRQRLHWI